MVHEVAANGNGGGDDGVGAVTHRRNDERRKKGEGTEAKGATGKERRKGRKRKAVLGWFFQKGKEVRI